jgi:ketosteroid isomerase-like protein
MQDNGSPASDQQAKLISEVLETERRWVQAHRDLDVAAIAKILDETYARIEKDGSISRKSDVVASYSSGERHWDVAEGSDYAVQVFEDTAVVVGIWRGVGVNHGQAFDYRARFIAVYVRRPDGWKLYRDEAFELDG